MKTLLCWSSGKDSAWTLGVLRDLPGAEVVGLLTTLNETHDRVAMHAVRRELLEQQAEAVGLPLEIVPIPYPCPNETYEAAMRRVRRLSITTSGIAQLLMIRPVGRADCVCKKR